MSLETVEELARSVNALETNVVVRVPWNDPVRLKRIVDIGLGGVMVPVIESVDGSGQFVRSVRYPPEGDRGIAGSRATGYGRHFEESVSSANGSILTIAQIESKAGLDLAEEIASVEGIDALFVGPADLSGELDVFGQWDSEEDTDTVERVVAAGEAADVPVGTFTADVDAVADWVERGFDFLIAGKDAAFLMEGTRKAIDRYDAAVPDRVADDGSCSRFCVRGSKTTDVPSASITL